MLWLIFKYFNLGVMKLSSILSSLSYWSIKISVNFYFILLVVEKIYPLSCPIFRPTAQVGTMVTAAHTKILSERWLLVQYQYSQIKHCQLQKKKKLQEKIHMCQNTLRRARMWDSALWKLVGGQYLSVASTSQHI